MNKFKPLYLRQLEWVYFFLCMVYISDATFLTTIDWLFIPIILIGWTCFQLKKCKLDKVVVLAVMFFTLISSVQFLLSKSDDNYPWRPFFGFYFRILIPYFLIKTLGDNFFKKYEKVVYYGALISLPLFTLLLFDPHFFMKHFSNINMSEELRTSVGYWNFFIYTSHGTEQIRNDGFAVEPGHFGYLLGIAICYNLLVNKFKINKRLVVMTIAGLTTFSTTFYLTLLLFFVFYFLNTKSDFRVRFFLLSAFLVVLAYIINLDFMADKIKRESLITQDQLDYGYDQVEYGRSLVRSGAFKVGIVNFLNNPFGYGVTSFGKIKGLDGEYLTGPNGLISFVNTWGITGVIFLVFFIRKLIMKLKCQFPKYRGFLILPLIFLFYLYSNSISRDVLVAVILYYPFVNTSGKDSIRT